MKTSMSLYLSDAQREALDAMGVAGGLGTGEDSWVWVRGFRAGAYRKLVVLGLAQEMGQKREDHGTMFAYTLTLKGAEFFATEMSNIP